MLSERRRTRIGAGSLAREGRRSITLPMESTMHVVRPNVEKKRLSRSEADPASSSPGSLNRTAIIATPGRSSLRDATPNANRFL
ncbi:hypothetical protein DTO169C6_140 [Paecilomyces variotii]|nr:hypothetical protein DTO169C6_140 [Paecilomyces variotii]